MWEHGNIGQFWKGTREQGPPPPPGRPSVVCYKLSVWSTTIAIAVSSFLQHPNCILHWILWVSQIYLVFYFGSSTVYCMLIVSITKSLILIGSSHIYLSSNWHKIMWVTNYSFNWIPVFLSVNNVHLNMFFSCCFLTVCKTFGIDHCYEHDYSWIVRHKVQLLINRNNNKFWG